MNVRKLFTKIALTLSAFFWVGCSEDNNSEPVIVGPISDCDDDGSLNYGNASSNCGGGMIALYGVAPVFIESSSSIFTESSSSKVDREAALARGETLCAEHNGVREMIQYEPPWGSPESRADGVAREEVRDSVEKVLKTSVAKKFSFAKRSCLEKFAGNDDMAVLYGAPIPAEENPYDIWQYICKNGVILKDEAYQEKDREYDKAFDEAKKESLERYRKEVDDCGKS